MKRQIVRVEPFSTYAEKRKVPISLVVITQMERCLEAAGSSLGKVIQSTVYCNDPAHLQTVNEV
jgi:2-iminobutanoate/2-iminopropanoate deaminase